MKHIRPIHSEDFEQWYPLWEMYNIFYARKVSLEVTQETWKRFLDTKEEMYSLVYEDGEKILGFVNYLFHRHTAMINKACYLQDLFTLQSARGKGVGRALIEEVSRLATEAGTPSIYWLTHEKNETARKLYDKVATDTGFIVYRKYFEKK